MEEIKGLNRGSYIWGNRSIRNIRIECLCRLEQYESLDPKNDAHIWLLHHLFLDAINVDALAWAESWNHHPLTIPHQMTHSPTDLFVFGMMEKGVRGLDDIMGNNEEEEELPSEQDLDSFDIDWNDYDNDIIHSHHDANNICDSDDAYNPFDTHRPEQFSHVEVESVECPLTHIQVEHLDTTLEHT
ncbi:hypothetical protein IW261DRAFT_1554182 [Armillaria novae-zelandiae]|uniref:Integrase core domain-containing protein n=1 Tax=Armillaria novae-zelandiae TaxID=153914 RepID=A0AA39NCX3_9AGAR|nr:hypothetical protein IW261DRAFT_1554182 [Armillaria novae-zelandiae]